ncbi:MAG TPA: fasciclin domain-containing protein [Solirubrobacter sp.]|nr:fasciclin domain-containing protein [Solirubrobacter sp.]
MRFKLHVTTALAAAALPLAAAAPASAKPAANIVETAQSAGQFTTLVSLVQRAGLADTLSGRGPFTVFAPTDKAFAKVPKKTLNALLKNKSKLREVLLYHVVDRNLKASKVVKRSSIKTVNGARVDVRVRGSRVFLDKSRVTTPDIAASNGTIHVINRVLIP